MNHRCTEILRVSPRDPHGPYRESLSSLVIRTARENDTSPALLLERKFASTALHGLRCCSRALGSSIGQSINGSGATANAFVARAESLTRLGNLRASTTIAFAPFTTINGLLRQQLSWSADFLKQSEDAYYPLLWALDAVRVCSKTRKPLSTCCPRCRKILPVLTGGSHVGRCFRCGASFADVRSSASQGDPLSAAVKDFEYELWIADQLGSFIQFQTNQELSPHFDYTETLTFWLRKFDLKVSTKSASALCVSQAALSNWLAKESIPKLRATMALCWIFGISLLQFLHRQVPANHDGRLRPPAEAGVRHASRSARRRIDRPALQRALTDVLLRNRYAMLSFADISLKKLNRKPEVVRQRFPSEARAISRRYLENRRLMAEVRRDQFCTAIKTIARFLHSRGIVPNHKTLAPYLDHPTKLRCAWAIAAIREIRTELGYEDTAEQLWLPV